MRTRYHHKHAIRVLKNQEQVQNHLNTKAKTFMRVYAGEVVQALERIWDIYGQICSKRLQPILPEAIRVLERCQEISLSKSTKELLLKISSASIDRCLRPVRIKSAHGVSTTKLGSLLKKPNSSSGSRPYKKNDQAHVEQKNWSVARRTVGYDRWETEQEFDTAKTPYQRVLESKDISLEYKARLMNLYLKLNPAELRRSIDKKNRQKFLGNISS